MPRLILQCADLAPVDQLIWSVWGFCVLEACSESELCLEERSLRGELAGLEQELATFGDIRVRAIRVAGPEPDERFAVVSSTGLVSQRLLGAVSTLHVYPHAGPDALAPEWFWDAEWMARFRQRALALAGKMLNGAARSQVQARLDGLAENRRPVSLISSVFQADRFLAHFLENCVALTGYHDSEHWLVRPGSPGDEHDPLSAHVQKHPGAIYINLPEDPGLYESWNMAATLAGGRYLSNANIDDVRHRDHVARLRELLEAAPEADMASSALRVTAVPNQRWSDWQPGRTFYSDGEAGEVYGVAELIRRKPDGTLTARNKPHCMPLWRRALHLFNGFFNEREYGPSADWEFWLRCGASGSRFVRTPELLGMYLESPGSYWHRDGGAGGFDRRILSRYGRLLNGGLRVERVMPPAWKDASRFEAAGNWLGVLVALLRLHACASADSGREGTAAVEDRARRLFGVSLHGADETFKHAILGPGGAEARLARLTPLLIDLLRQFCAKVDPDDANAIRTQRWRELLVDWYRIDGGLTPLAGMAWLARHARNDTEGERRILCAAHRANGQAFWPAVQRVYRHSVPLQEMNEWIGACRTLPAEDGQARGSARLAYYPAYSNTYQSLLYRPLQRAGEQLRALKSLSEMESLMPLPGAQNILHLHWLNALFAGNSIDFETRAEEFIELLETKQRQGFRVFWTVHNRLNHDTDHPDAEKALRRRLATLVDRVYVHHPMVPGLLEWWPDGVEPWLCEHGGYDVESNPVGQEAARAKLEIAANARVFLWFGQVRPYKGLEDWLPTMLDTLAGYPDARLVIAGPVHNFGVDRLVRRSGGQVRLIDRFVDDDELGLLASAADFGLLTYRDILTSGAMVHLYSFGVPVIAPEMGTLPAYVVPGWNGALYRDTASLDQALRMACGTDGARLAAYGKAALETAAAFRWGRVV